MRIIVTICYSLVILTDRWVTFAEFWRRVRTEMQEGEVKKASRESSVITRWYGVEEDLINAKHCDHSRQLRLKITARNIIRSRHFF
ncbi:hypothetical protein DMENIID0001_141190 [Sergentomyia squamirostris]